jgi:acetoin utilization protein AcuC
MTGRGTLVVWGDELLSYDLGEHPLDPLRVELTMQLARAMGVLDRPGVVVEAPRSASDDELALVHERAYLEAVRAAPHEPSFTGWGLGTPDNPIVPDLHEISALVVGATLRAAEAVWHGEALRAVNMAGGLHHAMPARASGFCIYNDPAVAIARLLQLGADRIGYVDIDVHHGDGVQAVFWRDPRVLTISLHETPAALFPGTGYPSETGGPGAEGSAVNLALPPGTDDAGWLRAFHAVVPAVLRSFRPQVLVTQCGADTYRHDPLADLQLTVDGQRATYLALRSLAEELCQGRWIATGGGGYRLVEAVPRAWTHLLAVVSGDPIDPAEPVPGAWQELVRQRLAQAGPRRRVQAGPIPDTMTDGGVATYQPWPRQPADPVDRAVLATRRAVFGHHGLDPDDPQA